MKNFIVLAFATFLSFSAQALEVTDTAKFFTDDVISTTVGITYGGGKESMMLKNDIQNYLATGQMTDMLREAVNSLKQIDKLLSDDEAVTLLLEEEPTL